jgi:hypothetical protein
MAPKVADLRGMSDEEVIRWHDDLSNQGTSSSCYLDELRRREAERALRIGSKLERACHAGLSDGPRDSVDCRDISRCSDYRNLRDNRAGANPLKPFSFLQAGGSRRHTYIRPGLLGNEGCTRLRQVKGPVGLV